MESLRDNKKLLYGLGLAYAIVWVSVSEVFPPINDGLEVSLAWPRLNFFNTAMEIATHTSCVVLR